LKEKATGITKKVYLPVGVQIHYSELKDEFYVINAHRLAPSEEPVLSKSSKSLSKEILEHMALIDCFRK